MILTHLKPLSELHKDYPIYHWFPSALLNATHSAANLAVQLHHHISIHPNIVQDSLSNYIRAVLLELGLGVYDATDAEINALMDVNSPDALPASYIFADIISRRAQVGWSTHGHSAVDVNIYASSPKAARKLVGNHENTEIGDFIREYLDVDLEAVTKELVAAGDAVGMGKPVADIKAMAGLDHYAGDFKRSFECDCGAVH